MPLPARPIWKAAVCEEKSKEIIISGENSIEEILRMFPERVVQMKTFEGFIKNSVEKHGFDYVKHTAEYTIMKKPSSYKSYLLKALEGNWADEYIAQKKSKENKKNKKEEMINEAPIEEAQIVEDDYKIKIRIQKDVIVDKVKAITKTDKETFEKLLKIQEILKTYEIITIDNYVLNDYTQEIQNLIEIRSRKADILLEHDASTIKYLSSSLNIDNNNILCTWDRSLIEYKSIHKLQFHILSPIALIDLLSMAKGEKTNYALASYKNFAKLQNEQILEMSSIVWETLIKIERNELLDGELIRKAKSFQNTYAEKYHNLDELDQKKISEDWLAWKELH